MSQVYFVFVFVFVFVSSAQAPAKGNAITFIAVTGLLCSLDINLGVRLLRALPSEGRMIILGARYECSVTYWHGGGSIVWCVYACHKYICSRVKRNPF